MDLVEEVVHRFARSAHSKSLELLCAIDAAVGGPALGSPNRLRVVLSQLLAAGIDRTKRGEVRIAVAPELRAAGGERLRFEVRDTGSGRVRAAAWRGLELVAAAGGATLRRPAGRMVHRLVARMGGEMSVEQPEDGGSIVRLGFEMPLCAAPGGVVRPEDPRPVLVVDDNASSRRDLLYRLGGWGVEAVAASGGREALLIVDSGLAADGFSLVLADLEMPEMDGLELAARLGAPEGAQGAPVVVLMTAGRRPRPDEILQCGVTGTLAKPVRRRDLQLCLSTPHAGHRTVRTAS